MTREGPLGLALCRDHGPVPKVVSACEKNNVTNNIPTSLRKCVCTTEQYLLYLLLGCLLNKRKYGDLFISMGRIPVGRTPRLSVHYPVSSRQFHPENVGLTLIQLKTNT